MQAILAQLKALLLKLLPSLQKIKPYMNEQTPNSIKVYEAAKAALDKKLASDAELGCVEVANAILIDALGVPIVNSASTIDAFKALQDLSRFIKVDSPLTGDFIICVSGQGNGVIPHGHIGVIANFGIISNDSDTGLVKEKWDLPSWQDHYGRVGGFPVYYFRAL